MTSASLTHEELETVIVEIEAILNSRSLTSMSTDPNDLTALTPGHFLIGEPLTAPVDSMSKRCKTSLLTRWKLVSHLKQEFWRRWSHEYLNELQHRFKWKNRCENVEPGTIVVIKEDNTPVMKWPLGRILLIHKGTDSCARVADVRTASGVLRRPIHRLSPLPTEAEHSHEGPIDQESHKTPSSNEANDVIQSTGNSHDHSTTVPRKKARTSLGSLIVSAWLVCLLAPAIRGSLVEVSKFDTRPGIHFEQLGATKLVSTEWNLVAYYDLEPYWTEFNAFESGTRTLEHLCNQIKQKVSCSSVTTQFQHALEELRNDNDLLPIQGPTNRKRRVVLNIVGNVANSLFGVLDSQYAEDAIKGNENHLMLLIKNQTSIIDSTINIIKRDQKATDHRFRVLEAQMTQLISRINDTGDEAYQYRILQLFTSLAIQMTLISNNLQKIHSTIVDVLTDFHHGQIPPQLLSPSQLKEETLRIQTHLPQNLRLPANQENILQLYKMITVEGQAINNYVIFKINVPLINIEQFDLFRILPVPLYINDTFIAIHPCASHLANTSHRDQHYPLTDQELASCKHTEKDSHLCKQIHPVYHRKANVCSCESDLLNGISNPGACHLITIENHPIWIQLSHTNQWIYALKENTLVNAVCENETVSTLLNGSGLLKIQPGCIIKHEFVTLQGHHIYSSDSRLSYTKLGDILNTTTSEQLASLIQEKDRYLPQLRELQELQARIKTQSFDFPYEISTHTMHTLAVGYIGLALVIIIIAWLLYKFRRDGCNSPCNKPKPKPRPRQVHQDFVINIDQES